MIGSSIASDNSMYMVLPVPFRMLDGRLYMEAQAANGLDRWAEHFSKVTVAAPLIPEALLPTLSGFVWRDLETLEHRERAVCQPLPWTHSPMPFLKQLPEVRKQIRASIEGANHLQFAISGLAGDWASVAALEAIKLNRRYAIHTDCVEYELMQKTVGRGLSLRRLRVSVEAPVMKMYHRHLIKHCSLGLWHGNDCYRAYSPWCGESHLIHDIHTKQKDLIDPGLLSRKLDDIRSAEELRIVYAGRLAPMKAPMQWLAAIAAARDMGARLKATWYGEGPLLPEALAERKRLNLEDIVSYPGFVAGREELLDQVRSAHAMVFTHITPESPRNLLESLISGTPILGYQNEYASDLIDREGGGALVPIGDSKGLGALIATMAADREALATLSKQAALNGRRFTDAAVFAERSELIRQFA